jgi:hypothetical protein
LVFGSDFTFGPESFAPAVAPPTGLTVASFSLTGTVGSRVKTAATGNALGVYAVSSVGEDGKEVRSVKFEISEVIIEGGKVGVGVGSNSVSVLMPRLELRDIGKSQGGITAEQATLEVMKAVLGSVTRSVASSPGGAVNSLRRLIDRNDD